MRLTAMFCLQAVKEAHSPEDRPSGDPNPEAVEVGNPVSFRKGAESGRPDDSNRATTLQAKDSGFPGLGVRKETLGNPKDPSPKDPSLKGPSLKGPSLKGPSLASLAKPKERAPAATGPAAKGMARKGLPGLSAAPGPPGSEVTGRAKPAPFAPPDADGEAQRVGDDGARPGQRAAARRHGTGAAGAAVPIATAAPAASQRSAAGEGGLPRGSGDGDGLGPSQGDRNENVEADGTDCGAVKKPVGVGEMGKRKSRGGDAEGEVAVGAQRPKRTPRDRGGKQWWVV